MKLHRKIILSTLAVVLPLVLAPLGAADTQLATCHDQWPAWSPDGGSIVFTSTRTGDHEIFTLSLADGQVRQLTDTPGRDAHPAFSPDGRQIAFQSPRGDGNTNLYLMDVDGTGLRRLTHESGFLGVPAWSPDGKRLAYQWRPEVPGARWQLMTLTLSDRSIRPITNGSANDQVVNWSPDGNSLLFHSDRTGKNQIYTWSDGVTRRVIESPFNDSSASWSPDGGRISFVSERASPERGIYVMNPDGSSTRRIGTLDAGHSLPFFSPDGRTLLVTPTTETGTEVWTLSVDDGTAKKLTSCTPASPQ